MSTRAWPISGTAPPFLWGPVILVFSGAARSGGFTCCSALVGLRYEAAAGSLLDVSFPLRTGTHGVGMILPGIRNTLPNWARHRQRPRRPDRPAR
jgi:hypothetical protein